ncbi:MAG: hypothetical protein STSR0008_21140 [Ignavibacterium sp.]
MKKQKFLYSYFFLLFFLISIFIIGLAFLYYQSQIKSFNEDKYGELTAISKLKSKQIMNWISERRGEADFVFHNQHFKSTLKEFVRNPKELKLKNEMIDWLLPMYENHDYRNIFIVDAHYKIILAIDSIFTDLSSDDSIEIKDALIKKQTFLSDFKKYNNIIYLDIYVPITYSNTSKSEDKLDNKFVIIFRIDPFKVLYPLIQEWPVSSTTSETFLIRREKDSILYLNELRHKKNTAMNFRLPTDKKYLTANLAIQGKKGIVESKDYRDKNVLAYITEVPEMHWYLISKIDNDEIMQPLERIKAYTFLIVVISILLTWFIIYNLWYRRNSKLYKKLYEEESKRKALLQHFEYLNKYANDIIWLIDEEGNFIEVNDKACQVYGYSKEEFLKLNAIDIRKELNKENLKKIMNEIDQRNGLILEAIHFDKNRNEFPVEISTRTIIIGGKKFYQSIIRDISERKNFEKKIIHLNKVYAVLSNINQLIVRERNEIKIFEETCNIAVELGKFKLAWIGLTNNNLAETNIEIKIYSGVKGFSYNNFLTELEQTLRNAYESDSLTANTIKSKNFTICDDIENDTRNIIGKEEALKLGLKSFISLPLIVFNKIYGVINIYSDEKEFFNEQEIKLLDELSKDISFAVEFIKTEEERNIILENYRATNNSLEAIISASPVAIMDLDFQGNVKSIYNKTAENIFGWKKEEAIGKIPPFISKNKITEFHSFLNQILSGKSLINIEVKRKKKDGSDIYVLLSSSPIYDSNGKITGLIAVLNDITALKKIENDLNKLNLELEHRVKERTYELEIANNELESFSYSVSHDLRAPLRHIIGFINLLNKRNENQLDEKGKYYFNVISESAKKMENLIEDILNFSRMSRIEMMTTEVNLQNLVYEIKNDLITENKDRKINWIIHPLPIVKGDSSMLRLVLFNLISNSVKFTRKNEITEIEIGHFINEDNENVFFVKDNGVGFDTKYIDKLFGVFQRQHSETEFEGTGIGLAIVRRIINRHHGKVWAESKLNEGSTFYFTLMQEHL